MWQLLIHPKAEAEIRALPPDVRARFLRIGELLTSFGPRNVGMPHVRHIEGALWEMRMSGRDGIARALYAALEGERLVVLHAFGKKTQKTPRAAIETARRRLNEVQQ